MALLEGTYLPDSDLLITISGAVDSSGTPLTGSTATCKITVTTADGSGTVLVSAAAMTYSGTPGTFTYSVAAALIPDSGILRVRAQIYNAAGSTLHWTQDMRLRADW